jgi:hypothetical protein
MSNEIIFTEHYALIVSDEEMSTRDYRVNIQRSTVHYIPKDDTPSYYNDRRHIFKKVIAHRPLTDAPILKGVPLLPEFIQEEDAEDLALAYSSSKECVNPEGYSDKQVGLLHGFIDGYNKAKETYKYTKEDLIKAIEMAITSKYEYKLEFYNQNEIIQSLQQPKRPKYFECETITMNKGYTDKSDYPYQECEILKTITNSQGQTELVGEYIF